jgi:hypothetical protein
VSENLEQLVAECDEWQCKLNSKAFLKRTGRWPEFIELFTLSSSAASSNFFHGKPYKRKDEKYMHQPFTSRLSMTYNTGVRRRRGFILCETIYNFSGVYPKCHFVIS